MSAQEHSEQSDAEQPLSEATNWMAVAALVLGLLGVLILTLFFAYVVRQRYLDSTNVMPVAAFLVGALGAWILALFFGHAGRRQIDAPNGRQKGRGFATAGIVLGRLGLALTIAIIAISLLLAANAGPGP